MSVCYCSYYYNRQVRFIFACSPVIVSYLNDDDYDDDDDDVLGGSCFLSPQ